MEELKERQRDELQALQAIFMDGFKDLRDSYAWQVNKSFLILSFNSVALP